jgi:arginine repressor
VAQAPSNARLRGALGTIAGDDTIFVAPAPAATRATPGGAARLAQQLRRLFSV